MLTGLKTCSAGPTTVVRSRRLRRWHETTSYDLPPVQSLISSPMASAAAAEPTKGAPIDRPASLTVPHRSPYLSNIAR
jgi:hypothetical protein